MSDLASRTSRDFPDMEIAIRGAGVFLSIETRREDRCCSIEFFPKFGLPAEFPAIVGKLYSMFSQPTEYSIVLKKGGEEIAVGRTVVRKKALSCVTGWVGEQLPLEDIYDRFDFIDKNLRVLKPLAEFIDRAQRKAGSDSLTTLEHGSAGDPFPELWLYRNPRSCQLIPVERSKKIRCNFLGFGTELASATLRDMEAAARSVNSWLDQAISLDEFQRETPDLALSDFALEFDRGDVALWCWSNLLKRFNDDEDFAEYLPVVEALKEIPEVNRFFPYTGFMHLGFSLCSHYPFCCEGTLTITPKQSGFVVDCGEGPVEGDTEEVVSIVTRHLARISEQPFVGNANDSLLKPINACLAEQGSALRVERTWRRQFSEISVGRGDRKCILGKNFEPMRTYSVHFHAGGQNLASSRFWTLPDVIEVLHMWLEQGCELEDIEAITRVYLL